MIIIETCPNCGHDLLDEMICTMPPIPRKVCPSCGWTWEGEPEQVIRMPFGGNRLVDNMPTLTTTNTTVTSINLQDYSSVSAFEQPACINCSANPKNGGDGICFCTLGQKIVY